MIAEPSDEEAMSVCALTTLAMPEVTEFVFALIFEASEVEAARTVALVLAFTFVVSVVMAEPSEDEAVVTSD